MDASNKSTLLAELAHSHVRAQEAPSDATAQLELASVLTSLGRWAEAGHALDRADALSPGWAQVQFFRASLFMSQGRYQEAIYQIGIALSKGLGHPQIHEAHGIVLIALGRNADALGPLRRAWELGQGNPELFARLSSTLRSCDEFESLLSLTQVELDQALTRGDRKRGCQLVRTLTGQRTALVPAEIALCAGILASDPSSVVARLLCLAGKFFGIVSTARTGQESLYEDVCHFQWLIHHCPDLPGLGPAMFLSRRKGSMISGKLIALWEKELPRRNNSVYVLENAAEFFHIDGQFDRSSILWERLGQMQPWEPRWLDRAAAELLMKLPHDQAGSRLDLLHGAWKLLKRAEELAESIGTSSPERWLALGYVCHKFSKFDEAKRWTFKMLESQPMQNSQRDRQWRHAAYTVLGLVALAKGEREDARQQLMKSLQLLERQEVGVVMAEWELAGELTSSGMGANVIGYISRLSDAGEPRAKHYCNRWLTQVESGRRPEEWWPIAILFSSLGIYASTE